MSTPRKRWVKQPTSILREPWPRDVKLAAILLSCYLGDRWARDGLTATQACRAVLSRGALTEISGRSQLESGRNVLRKLSERVSLSIQVEGDFTSIHWPKWAIIQNLPSDDGAKQGPENAPSAHAPSDAHAQEGKKKSPRIRSDPAPWAMTLSALLIDELKGVPGASFTRGCEKRWAREIEALVREVHELQGHQDPAEPIAEMIRWALGPENLGRPYAVVIRSGASLREKWPKLVAARQRRDAYDEDRDGIGPRLMRELAKEGLG